MIERHAELIAGKRDQSTGRVNAPYIFKIALEGRYGRLNYLNALGQIQLLSVPFIISGLLIIAALSASKMEALIFMSGLLLPFYLLSLRAVVLRLHDLNYCAWWSLVGLGLFIPGVGFIIVAIFVTVLSLLPGSPGTNRYGLPSRKGALLGVILEILMIILVIYILFMLIGIDYLLLGA